MDVISYKGFEVRARPQQIEERWTIAVEIRRHRRNGRPGSRQFSGEETCPTRKDAVQRGFAYGKQIVDGEIENCSVRDL